MTKIEILALQKAAIVLKGLADSFQNEEAKKETLCLVAVVSDAVKELQEYTKLVKRLHDGLELLYSQIDGGEECRGRDSEISSVIRRLEGEA